MINENCYISHVKDLLSDEDVDSSYIGRLTAKTGEEEDEHDEDN